MPKNRNRSRTPLSQRDWAEFFRIRTECRELVRDLETNPQIDALIGSSAVMARRLFADAARVLSREPSGRALVRLPSGPTISRAVMLAAIFDLQRALAGFHQAHDV